MPKACARNAIVSMAENLAPLHVNILIKWVMRGVSATSATVIGTTSPSEIKANPSSRKCNDYQQAINSLTNYLV